ncbi:hypothetical protein HDU97_000969 [Phlyctochytrium planicorne]|nr:hypothetical protein HDU97_000969 [Phlyctochytrium planicorne]
MGQKNFMKAAKKATAKLSAMRATGSARVVVHPDCKNPLVDRVRYLLAAGPSSIKHMMLELKPATALELKPILNKVATQVNEKYHLREHEFTTLQPRAFEYQSQEIRNEAILNGRRALMALKVPKQNPLWLNFELDLDKKKAAKMVGEPVGKRQIEPQGNAKKALTRKTECDPLKAHSASSSSASPSPPKPEGKLTIRISMKALRGEPISPPASVASRSSTKSPSPEPAWKAGLKKRPSDDSGDEGRIFKKATLRKDVVNTPVDLDSMCSVPAPIMSPLQSKASPRRQSTLPSSPPALMKKRAYHDFEDTKDDEVPMKKTKTGAL